MVLTPGKNFPGQKGFPTPSDVPSDTACRSFVLPDNDEWFGLLMGAIELLLNPHNYFNYGALSIDDTVDAWQLIIQDAYNRSLTAQCAPEIPAPYWETAANVGDQEPSLVQVWYGELVGGLTFNEVLGNIFIAGFVLSGAGLGAAIQFLVLARRFRLALRAHDLGSVVRIFINASEYGTVDTYSATPNIIFYDVYAEQASGASPPYTLWVEQHSSSQMQAIRKELREDEVYPSNIKYDGGTDQVQEDFGSGFVDNPNADPRHNPGLLYPPVGSGDPQCLAAANMTDFFDNLLTSVEDALAGASSATALWAVILPFLVELGPFAVLIELISALATVLFTAGDTALHAAFTTTTFDDLLCIFYCDIATDGSVSAAQLAQIETDITTHFGVGLVNDVMQAALFLMGEVGLSNRGTLGASSRTCTSCDCTFCYEWDFTIEDYAADGWAVEAPYGQYATGQGWQSTYLQGLILDLTFPSAHEITSVQWGGTNFGGIGPYGRAVLYTLSGSTVYNSNEAGISNPYTQDVEHTDTVDKLRFNPYAGSTADTYIQHVRITSTLEIPEWTARAC